MHIISAADFPLFCSNSAQKCLILPAECSPQKSLILLEILSSEFIQAYRLPDFPRLLISCFLSADSSAAYTYSSYISSLEVFIVLSPSARLVKETAIVCLCVPAFVSSYKPGRNIVRCDMLRPFGHAVACCCAKSETGQAFSHAQTKQCWELLRPFACSLKISPPSNKIFGKA